MARISGNEQPEQNLGSGKLSGAEYEKRQEALSKKIKPQAESLADLKNAREIKKQQINLAKSQGDTEAVRNLQADLARIEADIRKNTSIFCVRIMIPANLSEKLSIPKD